MLVFNKAIDLLILAKENTTLMPLGGEPLGERFIWWNFVSSSKERTGKGRLEASPNNIAAYRQ